jgi:arylsulfatase A-like enzyme
VDGISFVPQLRGDANAQTDRPFVWHFPHNSSSERTPFSAIRQGPWKLIYHHVDRRLELFNIDDDIGESRDLAKVNPAITKTLAKVLGDRLRDSKALMPIDKTTGHAVELPDELGAKPSGSPLATP